MAVVALPVGAAVATIARIMLIAARAVVTAIVRPVIIPSVIILSVVIAPIVITPVIMPPVVMARPVMVWLRRGLPDNRRHVLLPRPHRTAGFGHGPIRIGPPVVAIGVNLRGHKKSAVILLFRGSGRHDRGNDVASLRIPILGRDAPVVKIFALELPRA